MHWCTILRPQDSVADGISMKVLIRPYRAYDADACLSLFRDCVHRVNSKDYTLEQINAWAPATADSLAWTIRFTGRYAYVACERDIIVGFTDMTNDGHLDRLFVSAAHQRLGIARGLVERLFEDATSLGCRRLKTEASITAKPFFKAMGFVVIEPQLAECRGVMLKNFRMERICA